MASTVSEEYKSGQNKRDRPIVMQLRPNVDTKNLYSIDETKATLEETPVHMREADDDKVDSSGTSGCSFSVASSLHQSMQS